MYIEYVCVYVHIAMSAWWGSCAVATPCEVWNRQAQQILGVGPDPMAGFITPCKMQKNHQSRLVPQKCPNPNLNAASRNRSCLPHTSFLF